MGKRSLGRPSPAMVVAILALCFAVGGTAFAAVKLGKNAVKTKNIKNKAVTESKIAPNAVTGDKIAGNAVTESKIAGGAVSPGKLSASAKTIWAETDLGSTSDIVAQSGGVTITPASAGEAVVNFGTDVSNRAIEVTPNLNLGSVTAEYARCTRIACPTSADSPNAVEVFLWANDASPDLVNSGYLVAAIP
jgi:hypothetical protein